MLIATVLQISFIAGKKEKSTEASRTRCPVWCHCILDVMRYRNHFTLHATIDTTTTISDYF